MWRKHGQHHQHVSIPINNIYQHVSSMSAPLLEALRVCACSRYPIRLLLLPRILPPACGLCAPPQAREALPAFACLWFQSNEDARALLVSFAHACVFLIANKAFICAAAPPPPPPPPHPTACAPLQLPAPAPDDSELGMPPKIQDSDTRFLQRLRHASPAMGAASTAAGCSAPRASPKEREIGTPSIPEGEGESENVGFHGKCSVVPSPRERPFDLD